MPFNPVPTAFDDDEHTRLDALHSDETAIDPRYRDVMIEISELLQAHPQLKVMIQSAYAKRSFRDIHSLGITPTASDSEITDKMFAPTVSLLARSVFTIPSNIHSRNDNNRLALTTWFTRILSAHPDNTTEDAEALYLCFLVSLISKVNEKLERCHAEEQQGDKVERRTGGGTT
ncbi:hypothetical protein PILCRDRAFT_11068 [Piloderma croceum F 1598]|uniref:Uncharacterized protein n=1 Tax=Piloderma croceum (strain F 1598) TaxID=765440 RepID=A0A0C3BMV6_PILCF|nr:hypothetical protein PILCRDRAFT_11068 [Piloderma croceum F 1598]